ncbi:hypothetical protein [Paenibacillus agricola]|uniref:Inhibitor of sigma-G Gin protein n=1 Tax=Paenibacillus agricola TaxID=2716264 RepID=A0ABX0JAF2_9BACL|nr:hypothetical protein [Paenibacillus agricola]NHN33122.1 hypothetical protein [Paenibacillus agricola]
MKSKICGPCAIKEGVDLETRYALATERVPGTRYVCSICHEEHFLALISMPSNSVQESITITANSNQLDDKKLLTDPKAVQKVEQIKFFI